MTDKCPTQFKRGFLTINFITDTNHEAKPRVRTDLLTKTIVAPLKTIIIFKWVSCNLKHTYRYRFLHGTMLCEELQQFYVGHCPLRHVGGLDSVNKHAYFTNSAGS